MRVKTKQVTLIFILVVQFLLAYSVTFKQITLLHIVVSECSTLSLVSLLATMSRL